MKTMLVLKTIVLLKPLYYLYPCCGAGATTFRVEPRAGAAFFKAAPSASFWQAKKESLLVTKHDLKAIYNSKCDPKKTCK